MIIEIICDVYSHYCRLPLGKDVQVAGNVPWRLNSSTLRYMCTKTSLHLMRLTVMSCLIGFISGMIIRSLYDHLTYIRR